MKKKIGWAILGAGGIAKRFMQGMLKVEDAYLAAVGSRDTAKGEAFAAPFGAKAYTEYSQAVLDPEVDVVYVATPHTLHLEHTLLALNLGKPVLCEKPLAPNAEQVKSMAGKAQEKGLFLMEGMWTRFFPAIRQAADWVQAGEIGPVHLVTAEFGFAAAENPASRLFDPDLAGGSLLDVGVYTVAFASMIFGKKPNRIAGLADMTTTGVDGRMGCVLGYEGGGMASLFSAIRTNTPQDAKIIGESGQITIPKFWAPSEAQLHKGGRVIQEFSMSSDSEGFQYEIMAVQADLRAGRMENAMMPLAESIAIAETMDALRDQWGLVYPFEK